LSFHFGIQCYKLKPIIQTRLCRPISGGPMTVSPVGITAPAADPDARGVVGPPVADAAEAPVTLVEEDLLVEDVSIDGMCGVY